MEQNILKEISKKDSQNCKFSKDLKDPKYLENQKASLYFCEINTKLGIMVAVATQEALLLLDFKDSNNHIKDLEIIRSKTKSDLTFGKNAILNMLELELDAYFSGKSKKFNVPIKTFGTKFQELVWNKLKTIEYGQTWSYLSLAKAIGNPKAFRAVAGANSKNLISIIIPCHRVINSNNKLGGYSGGLDKKEQLLKLEQENKFKI